MMRKYPYLLFAAVLATGSFARADENRAFGGIRAYAGYLMVASPRGLNSDPANNVDASVNGLAFGAQFFLLNPVDPVMVGVDAGYFPGLWESTHYKDATANAYWSREALSAVPVHAVMEYDLSGFFFQAGLGASFMHFKGYYSDGSVVDDTTARFSLMSGAGWRVFLGESTSLDMFARLYVVPGVGYGDSGSRKTMVCVLPGFALNLK
jgi:hypothetical protein